MTQPLTIQTPFTSPDWSLKLSIMTGWTCVRLCCQGLYKILPTNLLSSLSWKMTFHSYAPCSPVMHQMSWKYFKWHWQNCCLMFFLRCSAPPKKKKQDSFKCIEEDRHIFINLSIQMYSYHIRGNLSLSFAFTAVLLNTKLSSL